ncbi:ATP-dependent DNA helicase [Rhodoferax aquaticus]|uniref:DNA 5'-3' helicase n=1 Tax=Rhodoferax aquaticus TaxID=2527691 RepID=A0A515EQ19_9BURK|nr:ATP-dependent DNA helicase [Rhodoferax aquaticus]QDL54739.1 ATP-dependent DNA helicase [Rhodoferax aquaticus]
MDLLALVGGTFATGGALQRRIASYRPRAGQTQMAQAIAEALVSGERLVVQAGTGTGKTFAYLVPLLMSGERVLVSTATKTLQEQLFSRDIPGLLDVLALPTKTAILKGRSSYLCLHRLRLAREASSPLEPRILALLAKIELWSQTTRAGDLSEIQALSEDSEVLPLVSSTRDNCVGSRCQAWQACYVNLARKRALESDLVVINHHLFFADSKVRDSGVAELLPTVQAVVFDEAHHLNDVGVQFIGTRLSSHQLLTFSRELAQEGNKSAPSAESWSLCALDIRREVEKLIASAGRGAGGLRRTWSGNAPEGVSLEQWTAGLQGLCDSLKSAFDALSKHAERSVELRALAERAKRLLALTALFSNCAEEDTTRWLECGGGISLNQAPLTIRQFLLQRMDQAADIGGRRQSWIFTSATLGVDQQLSMFTKTCGLEGARTLRVESPFDFSKQAALFVPPYFPKPNEAQHGASVARFVAQSAEVLGGRTLVLTTTLHSMRTVARGLEAYFLSDSSMKILVQGQAPKHELLHQFSQLGSGGSAYILVASVSFWEGVDVVGDALQLLVIDKLPFAPPDDPLVQARGLQIENSGKNAFKELHLPNAIMGLMQGAGRLIRSEQDQGVLAICDTRLLSMGYGKKILAALPAMRVLTSQEEFDTELLRLTKSSTKDQC